MSFWSGVTVGILAGAGGAWLYITHDVGPKVAAYSEPGFAELERMISGSSDEQSRAQTLAEIKLRTQAASSHTGAFVQEASDYVCLLTVAGSKRAQTTLQSLPDTGELADTVSGWQAQLHDYEKWTDAPAKDVVEQFRPASRASITQTGFTPHPSFFSCPAIEVENSGRVGADRQLLDYTPWVATPAGNLVRAPVEGACLSSGFGARGAENARRNHAGIDYYNRGGGQIYAAGNGTVSFAGEDGAYGYSVRIDHGQGVESHYAHMVPGSLKVKQGDSVTLGQTLGMMGASGRATAIHLHYELRFNGKLVDPLQIGKLAALSSLPSH